VPTITPDRRKTDVEAGFHGFVDLAERAGLTLQPFQKRIARTVFDGPREVLILLPRGQGKTCLQALVALHHLLTAEPRSEELLPFAPTEIDALEVELGPVFGPLVTFAAETGLRTNEWIALERRDIDRSGPAVLLQRRYADGVLTPYPKTVGSRRRVPLSARALDALDRLPPRLDTPLATPSRPSAPGSTQGPHVVAG